LLPCLQNTFLCKIPKPWRNFKSRLRRYQEERSLGGSLKTLLCETYKKIPSLFFKIPRKLQKLVYADECLQADAYLASFIQRTLPVWFVLADIVPVRSYAKYFSAVKVDLVVEAPECAHCGLRSEDIMYCGGCRSVVYCSPVCQAAQWSVHKHACKIRPGSHEA
jgi:hypothetical protein